MPGELNIIPEMCIRRDVIKKNDKLISDDLYVCTKVDPADEVNALKASKRAARGR
jgi:hypothetical protein